MAVKNRGWKGKIEMRKVMAQSQKGSFTVEAALLCPFLCLMICGMLLFTLRLYNTVDAYAEKLTKRQGWSLTSPNIIRLEAVTEDLF